MVEQKIIDITPRSVYYKRSQMTNVLCSDGKYRLFTQTQEPDTFFTTPGYVRVNGKKVSGHLYRDTTYNDFEGIWKFAAYVYRKNHNLLPEWGWG